MSFIQSSGTEKPASKQNRRNVHVFDNTNVEEFLRQPSPDELKATSEMRVLQMIEELQRQTAEELENWSQGQDVAYTPLPPLKTIKAKDSVIREDLHIGDMVSSPISLTSPLTESNLISVPRLQGRADKGTSDKKSTKFTENREIQHSAEKKDSLSLSNKPSFQSFLKRVAKTPPPTASAKDVATSPMTLPPLRQLASKWPDVDVSGEYDDDEICIRIKRSNTPPPPKFATRRNPYDPKKPAVERLASPDTEVSARKPRPRSNSLPAFVIKRKPLPKDSPLFEPRSAMMKRTPTFDDIVFDQTIDLTSTNKSRSQSESEADMVEHISSLPPILISTLSRGKSIGKKLKTQARIAHLVS